LVSDLKVMPTPRHVDIAITGRCNLACQYCFYADEMAARTDLPTGRWLAFFEELGRLGVMDVTLTGGEAFTRPDLFELIDGVIANHMRYQILTNGTLITEKVLARFEEGKRRLRLNSIQVSIDGATAEVHDRSRPDSFERALRGLRLLLEAGFPVTVRVTVNRYNVDTLEHVAHLLLDEVGLPSFTTNEAYACGAADRAEDGIMLGPDQRLQAMAVLNRLAARYDGRISAQAGPQVMARELARIDRMLEEGRAGLPGRGTLSACGGVFSKISILHDGTIVPCHNVSALRLGTVGEDDLQQIWLEHPLMTEMRQRREIPLSTLESCRDCPYQGFCTGGCPGWGVFTAGRLDVIDPASCYRQVKAQQSHYTPEAVHV
jgi:SynChlorMet cassette radical SAM/SPASM protein ScmE